MKKLLAMLLAAAILLSLCACGSSEKEAEAHPEENRTPDVQENVQATTTSGEKIYEPGETIVTADGMVERDSKGALLLVIDFFGSCDALGTYDEYPKIIMRLR